MYRTKEDIYIEFKEKYETNLKIYKKALRDYKISSIPLIGYLYRKFFNIYTEDGLCAYFKFTLNKKFEDFEEFTAPTTKYKEDEEFYYKPGDLKPRIFLIEQAILSVKYSIENLNQYYKKKKDE